MAVAGSASDALLLRLKCWLAFEHWQRRAARWVETAKAGFDPNQPRVPPGNPDGGQWTRTGGGDSRRILSNANPANFTKPGTRLAQARRGGGGRALVRIGSNLRDLSPYQELQLDFANIEANKAIKKVKEVEPDWTHRTSLYADNFQSAIRKANDLVLEAQARLIQHGRQTHRGLIDIYRRQRHDPDLLGFDRFDRETSVVGYGLFDRLPVFGVNSKAPPYQDSDRSEAKRWLGTLIEAYPNTMQRENVGHKPNDAVFHAETTVLLRMARANGGTLRGREMTIYVERNLCDSCQKVLPLLGVELGNPKVTFVDNSTGKRKTMRDGEWKR